MSLLSAITAERWLITEDGLRAILAVAEREALDSDLARAIRAERDGRPSALALRDGRPLDGARYASVRDGVAIVPITGPIFRRANLLTEYSGGTATGLLAQDVRAALDDPAVGAVLLVVDSPGGEVTGIHELANAIHAGREAKPVVAYVEGMGASAAYWLASAAGEVVADATAALGSIGAVMAVRDPAKTTSREIEIVSSQSPRKRPDVTTEAGRGQLQQVVDDLAAVFVAGVARNRGVDAATVLDRYGRGGVLIGQAAVDAGLADRLGSFEETLAALAAQARERRPLAATSRGGRMSEIQLLETVMAEPAVTMEEVAALRAALDAQAAEVAALRAVNDAMARDARTQRLTALCAGWPGATADHLAALEAIGEGTPAAEAYARTMRAAAAQVEAGALFARAGTDAPAVEAGAWDEIDRRAKAMAAAEGITHAAAVARVATAEPALYARYLKER